MLVSVIWVILENRNVKKPERTSRRLMRSCKKSTIETTAPFSPGDGYCVLPIPGWGVGVEKDDAGGVVNDRSKLVGCVVKLVVGLPFR